MSYRGPNADLDLGPDLNAELDDGVLSIALHRAQKPGGQDADMNLALERLCAAVSGDDAIRVVVLNCHDSDFSAGLHSTEGFERRERFLRQLPQPVIAMVNGRCHDGLIALIGACDIVFAADDADFSLDGQAVQRNELVTQSVPVSELKAQTYALARELASKDALALRFTKQTLQRVPDIAWDDVLNFTATKQAELKALQAGRPSTRAQAIERFLAGQSKPGAGG